MSRSFRSRIIAAPLLAASLALAPAVGVGIATQAVAADFDAKYGEYYDIIEIHRGEHFTALGPRGFKQEDTYKPAEDTPSWITLDEGSGTVTIDLPEDTPLGNLAIPVVVHKASGGEETIYARFRVLPAESESETAPSETTPVIPEDGDGTTEGSEGTSEEPTSTSASPAPGSEDNNDGEGKEEGTSTEPMPDTEESLSDSAETTVPSSVQVTSLPADSASTSTLGTSADSSRPVLASTGANVGALAILAILSVLGGASFLAYRRKIG